MAEEKLKTVYIVGTDRQIEDMFNEHPDYITTLNSDKADLLCFTGGEDVNPAFYNERALYTTYFNIERDKREASVFNSRIKKKKVGICRGGQFLNVMSGGRMWQHINGHSRTHTMYYLGYKGSLDNPKGLKVTSTHHQMMRPTLKGRILGVANEAFELNTYGETVKRDFSIVDDVEIVHYPHTLSLCYQPHPEYLVKECRDNFFEVLDAFMIDPTYNLTKE